MGFIFPINSSRELSQAKAISRKNNLGGYQSLSLTTSIVSNSGILASIDSTEQLEQAFHYSSLVPTGTTRTIFDQSTSRNGSISNAKISVQSTGTVTGFPEIKFTVNQPSFNPTGYISITNNNTNLDLTGIDINSLHAMSQAGNYIVNVFGVYKSSR